MKHYLVTWVIDAEAESPEEAARAAWAALRRPNSIANVFKITEVDPTGTLVLDTSVVDLHQLGTERVAA